MAFVVETGAGLSNATSYISLAEAEDFVADYFATNTNWSGATDSVKQTALMQATQYLDLKYGQRWVERRTSDDQALDWPRAYVDDRNNYPVESDIIPVNIKRATVVMALEFLAGVDPLADIAASQRDIKSKSTQLGPIRSTIEYVGSKKSDKEYRRAHAYVREFLHSPGRLYRS
jgi:hypothetical protein